MYQRINRNSLGQFLRSRERLVHASSRIIPPVMDETGKHILKPALADTRGIPPLVNAVRNVTN